MIVSKRSFAISLVLLATACGPKTVDQANDQSTVTNETTAAEPSSLATPGQTLAFLKAGDAHACSTQAVKDTLLSMSFPAQPDTIRASEWEEYTAKVEVGFSMITLTNIDKDTSSVECNAHATIEGGSPHEVNVAYRVSPDLNDDTNYVVSALNEPLRQSINYATSQAIRPLLEQNAREEAEQTQRDADQPTPESAPAEPDAANDTVSNL